MKTHIGRVTGVNSFGKQIVRPWSFQALGPKLLGRLLFKSGHPQNKNGPFTLNGDGKEAALNIFENILRTENK
jgi:hypothetical protein